MTWTKVGDELPDNPALLQLPRGVRWMHLEFLVWSNKHGTDGRIPAHVIRKVTDEPDPAAAVDGLVEVGMWERDGDSFRIVGFLDDQPSAADVERTQALARERQRKTRQHRNGDHSLCDERYCRQTTSRVTDGVTNGVTDGVSHSPPTRPTRPTRAGGTKGKGKGRAERPRSAPQRGAARPEGTGEPRTPTWADVQGIKLSTVQKMPNALCVVIERAQALTDADADTLTRAIASWAEQGITAGEFVDRVTETAGTRPRLVHPERT